MRDLMTELKELRLHGMASAWEELVSQGKLPILQLQITNYFIELI